MNLIKPLTGIRWYAAFFVFLSHTYHFNYFGITGWARSILSEMGHMGVSCFFVLSGLVLFINYPFEQCKFKKFYVARFARIYPAYFLGVIASIPIEWFLRKDQGIGLPVLMHVLFLQGFSESVGGRLNDVGWTLSAESLFYLLFPILLIYVVRGNLLRLVGVCAVALSGTLISVLTVGSPLLSSLHFPTNRLFEFFLGMLLGMLYQRGYLLAHFQKHRRFWIAATIAIITGIILLPIAISHFPQIGRASHILYGILFALFIGILANLDRIGVPMPIVTHQAVVVGGEISYAFYLFHNLILRYFKGAVGVVLHQDIAQWNRGSQIVSAVLLFVSTVGISCFVFFTIESPCRKKIRLFFLPPAKQHNGVLI